MSHAVFHPSLRAGGPKAPAMRYPLPGAGTSVRKGSHGDSAMDDNKFRNPTARNEELQVMVYDGWSYIPLVLSARPAMRDESGGAPRTSVAEQ